MKSSLNGDAPNGCWLMDVGSRHGLRARPINGRGVRIGVAADVTELFSGVKLITSHQGSVKGLKIEQGGGGGV